MPISEIERIDAPGADVRQAIDAVLEVYNDAASGRPEPARWFGAFECTADGEPLGGALCVSYWDWVFVDLLHLPETLRGRGSGRRIMQAVETEALRRGCRGIWLDTATYQAPDFYRKLGFVEFARLPEIAPGVARHSFRKTAIAAWPDDGTRIVDDPPEASRAIVRDGLRAYNESRAGAGRRISVALVTRGTPGGAITGGVWGRILRDWMAIELLVVPDGLRGRGLGARMMADAEAIARSEGCCGVVLDTFSFQAPGFYRRLGYTVLGEVPDYPMPHSRYLLAKRLDGSPVLAEGAAAQLAGTA
ncbi:MAG TPA: GNAT family N-acetyltransferase [Acetobacteraceae bacterium]|jgi:GNAT superfamily N-acetyltransferase|nr:GNAT family N-acetyltransferase [Acetobacteraceae bacterium]